MAVLNAIYEEDFLGFSYGFRPGRSQHDALDALVVGITSTKVNYILDADIRSFFDAVSQDWLVRFLEHRIGDPRIIRLIQKWLKAGVLEDGVVTVSDRGTGQGSVISPLLANVYLHYVFDLWAERWRRREATGDMIIVRYADDIVVGFEHEADARRFWDAMRERLEEFALSLHPDKTRLIEFGRFAAADAQAARARQTGDLHLPGLHLHLRQVAPGRLPAPAEDPARPHAGEAQGDQGGAAAADGTSRSPSRGNGWGRSSTGYFAYHAVPTNSAALGSVPLPRHRPLAAHAAAAQPEGRLDVGADGEAGRRLAPQTAHPSSLAAAALRRQTPEVGAVCGNSARTDLCGGRPVMGVPTAILAYPDGPGLPLPGGDHGLGEPCRAGVAAVEHARRGVLCRGARGSALLHGRPEIFNTDQGSQFTSDDFTGTLERHKVTISMDGKGRYMDNIFVERLWRSLKYEEVYLNAYASVAEAKAGIGSWLGFYNEERQHQSLGYRTPRQAYEAECPWICGRSASPTGCAFAHIPTGTTISKGFNNDGSKGIVTVAAPP